MPFIDALTMVVAEEGGYVLTNNPADPGGETYAGISRKAWPGWAGWSAIDANTTDLGTLKSLVASFYKANFWVPLLCDQLPDRIACWLFDFAVNAGPTVALRCLQTAVRANPDCIMGPLTVRAVSVLDTNLVLRLAIAEQLAHYVSLEQWATFGKGWVNRVINELRVI